MKGTVPKCLDICYDFGTFTPFSTFTSLNKIMFDFIWNYKLPKIKKTTLIKQKRAGGLDMKDFSLFDKALKLNWVML